MLHLALTIIDGFVAMEGKGPSDWTPVNMGLIIAGKDVATDATAARVMGFELKEISHIRTAQQKGLGNIGNIAIVGSKVEEVRRVFKNN